MWVLGRILGVMAFAFLANTLSGVMFELGIEFSCVTAGGPGCGSASLVLVGWILAAVVCGAVLLVPFGQFILRSRNLDKLLPRWPLRDLARWIGLSLAIVASVLAALSLFGEVTLTYAPANAARGLGLMMIIALFPAVTEELAYRWVVYDYAKRHMTRLRAAGLSGLLFGAIHLNQVGGALDGLLLMAAAMSVTFLFVALYEWAGTLWAPVVMHWVWDMFFLHVGVTVSSNHAPEGALGPAVIDAAASGFLTLDYVFATRVLSGGDFGVDSSPVAIVIFALCAALLWRRRRPAFRL